MSNFDFIFEVHVGDVLGVSGPCFESSDACLRETSFVCGMCGVQAVGHRCVLLSWLLVDMHGHSFVFGLLPHSKLELH